VSGVAGAEGVADAVFDAGPVPAALVALTRNSYCCPFVRPVTVALVTVTGLTADRSHAAALPDRCSTVYPVTGEPPSLPCASAGRDPATNSSSTMAASGHHVRRPEACAYRFAGGVCVGRLRAPTGISAPAVTLPRLASQFSSKTQLERASLRMSSDRSAH